MRTRVRGLSAAVLLCATVPVFAQTTLPLARQPRTITLQESLAIATEKANTTDVRVECRVLCVSGKESRAAVAKLFGTKGEPKAAFLSTDEVKELLTNCMGDKTTNVLQAPAMTLPAGEAGRVQIVDSTVYTTGVTVKATSGKPMMMPITEKVETGTTFSVVATPSADGKSIALKLAYHDKQAKPHTPLLPVTTLVTPEFEGGSKGQPIPFTQFVQMPEFSEIKAQQTGKVPDGGTMAVLVGRQTRLTTANDDGVPMLSQIPYLNRLFKNAGEKTAEYDVVVLTTAQRFVLPEAVEPAKVVPAAAWGGGAWCGCDARSESRTDDRGDRGTADRLGPGEDSGRLPAGVQVREHRGGGPVGGASVGERPDVLWEVMTVQTNPARQGRGREPLAHARGPGGPVRLCMAHFFSTSHTLRYTTGSPWFWN